MSHSLQLFFSSSASFICYPLPLQMPCAVILFCMILFSFILLGIFSTFPNSTDVTHSVMKPILTLDCQDIHDHFKYLLNATSSYRLVQTVLGSIPPFCSSWLCVLGVISLYHFYCQRKNMLVCPVDNYSVSRCRGFPGPHTPTLQLCRFSHHGSGWVFLPSILHPSCASLSTENLGRAYCFNVFISVVLQLVCDSSLCRIKNADITLGVSSSPCACDPFSVVCFSLHFSSAMSHVWHSMDWPLFTLGMTRL